MIFSLSCDRWLTARARSRAWRLLLLAAVSSLLGAHAGHAAPGKGDIEQPTVDVRPLAPGKRLALAYWPFAAHPGAGTPTLLRVDVDARIRPEGCGPVTWSNHPVQASKAIGPFCVGVTEGNATPLLVVGRPGSAPYILVPTELDLADGSEGRRTVRLGQPTTPLPAVVEAIQRWAAAPEGR